MRYKLGVVISAMVVFLTAYLMLGVVGQEVQNNVLKSQEAEVDAITFGEYTLPTSNSAPFDICYNSHDTCIYFTMQGSNRIGKLTQSGTLTEYSIPTSYCWAKGICFNSHDNCIYFTEYNPLSNKIGKMTEDGTFTEFGIPSANAGAMGICFNSHDNCLYFTQRETNKIGKMTETGTFTEYAVPSGKAPYEICFDTNNNCIYFTQWDTMSSIGKMTEAGVFTIYSANGYPNGITFNSHDNYIYFTQASGSKIGKMTETGVITEYSIPTPNCSPFDICYNSQDNNLYFTECCGNPNRIGKMSETGSFTQYNIPTPEASAYGICFDSNNGNLYFVEYLANKVGTMTSVYFTPPAPDSANITMTVTQAGEWNLGNNNTMTAMTDGNIPIKTILQCEDGIDEAEIIFTPVVDGNSSTCKNMTIASGNSIDGEWQGCIPSGNKTGTLIFTIYAKSTTGKETTTEYTIEIVERPHTLPILPNLQTL